MYRVIKFFTDLQDNSHPYNVGDTFPREGLAVTPARYKELAGPNNKQGVPLIEKVAEEPVATPNTEQAEADEKPVDDDIASTENQKQADVAEEPVAETKANNHRKGRKGE